MKKILFGLILSALLPASALFAQTAIPVTDSNATNPSNPANLYESNVYDAGVSASLCSGMGISFRQRLASSPLAYKITGGAWKTHSLGMYDIGAEFQYSRSYGSDRLYALVGAGYYYYGHSEQELGSPTRFGIGGGYEINDNNIFGISLNLMLTVFEPSGDILPLPSIDLMVYFL